MKRQMADKDDVSDGFVSVDRRSVLRASSLVFAASTAAAFDGEASRAAEPASSVPWPVTRREIFVTAQTAFGTVRGFDVGGVKSFKGIPYGAPTGGARRFLPPQNPAPWTGVRDCLSYGGICPQVPFASPGDVSSAEGKMGEDCLQLNVWTPGVDNAKRAVLVGLVGGGWDQGSGNGASNDGGQLAKYGDVVVVTVTHRLASQGFLHLADLGGPPEFKYSGVCGLMDMVHALEWVRDNVANFGGDPSRVMIYGCSGGGWKTSTMLGVPAANGLFQRAAVQSGSTLRLISRDLATERALLLLSKLGISKSNVADIQKVPWQQLLAAQVAAVEEGAYFSAVLDGSYLPAQPFYPSAAPGMTPVSLMVGTTLEDTGGPYFHDWGLDEAGLIRGMDERFGGKGGEIVGLYRKYYPRKSPFLIEAQIMTDASNRLNAVRQAELKTQQRGGSAYLYRWDWPSPPGTLGATHGADAAAALRILGSPLLGVGVGSSSPPGAELPEGILMSARLAAAWVAFAKTGSPNNPLIPSWEPYNLETRPTMVFDVNTRLENDPQAELRHYWPPAPEGRVLKRGPDGLPHIASLI